MLELDPTQLYIIGVSGGCDSMALLDMTVKKGYKVVVAHVNYNLRHDTDVDYKVVHEYCDRHNVPFAYKAFTPEDYPEGNFQAVARDMRYAFYKELYDKYQAKAVLLAHHKDDVLETVYMQKERGGLYSYYGIEEKTTIMSMTIIRPLLDYRKQELRSYCEENRILYHDDYTNFETHFHRDLVRNTILNTFTKEEEESLLHYAYIQNKHREETYKSLLPYLDIYHREGKIYIEDIPISLRESFYYEILHEVMPYHAFSKNFIKEVDKQLSTTHPNINMMIHNYHIIKEYGYIYLTDTLPEGYSYTFDEWVPFTCKYFTLSRTGEMNHGIPLKEEDFPITIRSYKLGDIIKTKGGTKKVRRLFINAKIPSLKRQIYPLLVNKNGEILLIPGIAKNKEYLSTNPDYFVIQ